MVCRNTIQMQKVKECLEKMKTHPNAETVYYAVKKELPSVTLATVYRNLNKLAEDGQILKIEFNGEFRFDGDTSFHQHLVCKKCGQIFDYFDKNISKYVLKKFSSDSFEAENVCIMFWGLCKNCKKISGKK